jgi:Bacterial pre-peptidase C-terminal domain
VETSSDNVDRALQPYIDIAVADLAERLSIPRAEIYPSPDDGAGVDLIPFTISGVAFARFEMEMPGDPDIDLYLLGPDGKIVAQSTAGGTHEHIELTEPADGNYTMVVHGWSVPRPSIHCRTRCRVGSSLRRRVAT